MGTISGGSEMMRRLAVDEAGQLVEGLQAVLGPCVFEVAVEGLLLSLRRPGVPLPSELVGVETRIPGIERSHLREAAHRLAIRTADSQVHLLPLLLAEPVDPAGHGAAGHKALDVPLERARQRLVEVVDAEHEPSVRCREPTEVGMPRWRPRGPGPPGRHRSRARPPDVRRPQPPPHRGRRRRLGRRSRDAANRPPGGTPRSTPPRPRRRRPAALVPRRLSPDLDRARTPHRSPPLETGAG